MHPIAITINNASTISFTISLLLLIRWRGGIRTLSSPNYTPNIFCLSLFSLVLSTGFDLIHETLYLAHGYNFNGL